MRACDRSDQVDDSVKVERLQYHGGWDARELLYRQIRFRRHDGHWHRGEFRPRSSLGLLRAGSLARV